MYRSKIVSGLGALVLASTVGPALFAQDNGAAAKSDSKEPKAGATQPSEKEMMATMMALAKPGENHKLLADMVGTWDYKVKYWMNPDSNAPPSESAGQSVTRAVMGGRYVISEVNGKMQMPGPDGKMMDMDFSGMGVDGYDNAKKLYVSSWIDNMGTGIMNSEGTYDAAAKTLNYNSEYEPMPGMKTKVRMAVKVMDKDHHTMQFFEDRGGKEVKTMEIAYTRKS
jgi:hypothetical protein